MLWITLALKRLSKLELSCAVVVLRHICFPSERNKEVETGTRTLGILSDN